MPKVMPPSDDMDSLYRDAEGPDDEQKESIDQEEAEQMEETAVVPTKLLQGEHPGPPEEGDEIIVKVVKVMGKDTQIAYAKGKDKEEGGESDREGEEGSEEADLEEMNSGDGKY